VSEPLATSANEVIVPSNAPVQQVTRVMAKTFKNLSREHGTNLDDSPERGVVELTDGAGRGKPRRSSCCSASLDGAAPRRPSPVARAGAGRSDRARRERLPLTVACRVAWCLSGG